MAEENDVMKNIGGGNENNLRKYLILGGGVFVLFVIGIVVSKFMFSDNNKNNTAVILPPEIKTEKVQKQDDTALFNDIPVENEFQKPIVEEKKVEKKDELNNDIVKPETIPETNNQKIETPEIKEEKVVEQKSEPQKIQEEKKDEVKEKKVVSKPVKTKTTEKKVSRFYYIQVSATTRGEPSKKFLDLLKKNHYSYKIVEANVKGVKVKRVLVGGYTYTEAKNVLPTLKAKISSSAFIKKLK